jgi:hypothetical protein
MYRANPLKARRLGRDRHAQRAEQFTQRLRLARRFVLQLLAQPRHRPLQARAADRLEQIVARGVVELGHGVMIVGSHQHNVRAALARRQARRHVQAAQARHLDVEEHDVGRELVDQVQGLDAKFALALGTRRRFASAEPNEAEAAVRQIARSAAKAL